MKQERFPPVIAVNRRHRRHQRAEQSTISTKPTFWSINWSINFLMEETDSCISEVLSKVIRP